MKSMLKQAQLTLAIAVLTASMLGCERNPGSITAAELAMRIESGDAPLVLDVRTAGEYAEGHIPGAINISHIEIGERLSELESSRNDEIVVHCVSGKRAALAEVALREAGFADVRDLEGHMQQWTAGNYPVEPSAGQSPTSDE